MTPIGRPAPAPLWASAAHGVPFALERSRSGQGAHVWLRFAEALLCAKAGQLGDAPLTAAMDACGGFSFTAQEHRRGICGHCDRQSPVRGGKADPLGRMSADESSLRVASPGMAAELVEFLRSMMPNRG